jgi:type IV secretion system protein VirB6
MAWLNAQLATYIGTNTARLAAAIEPAVIALAALYVMVWGYLHLKGAIEEPFVEGVKRILTLGIVLGISLRLWAYNNVLVDTFFTAPAQLAAAVLGVTNPVATLDVIWDRGGTVAGLLWDKGGMFGGDFGFYLAGAFVWLVMGLVCVYAAFLIALSRIALAVLLALGPLFIVLLLFPSTRRFFEAWIGMLANYALIGVLTILVAALMLQIVESYAVQTAARGATIVTVDALNLLLVTALVFLILRQVLPMAAGLGRGLALSTGDIVGRIAGRAAVVSRAGGTRMLASGWHRVAPLAAAGVSRLAVPVWRARANRG